MSGLSVSELERMVDEYCARHGFDSDEELRVCRLGALIAGKNFQWDDISGLTDEETRGLEFERDHKYKSLPKPLVGVVVICASSLSPMSLDAERLPTMLLQALCAAVHQSLYKTQFGIADENSQRDSWLLGLVNSASCLYCAFIGCWLTEPMNAWFACRGTVFIACVMSALACHWQGITSKSTVAMWAT